MIDLKGQEAELRLTIQVKRKDTGKIDEYHVIGRIDPAKIEELKQEAEHGSNSHCGSSQRRD